MDVQDTYEWTRCIKWDLDGVKGVYHINAVDEVTQWEVACVTRISEAYEKPSIAGLLAQFPFKIQGFHSDNGSEFINYGVDDLQFYKEHFNSYLNFHRPSGQVEITKDNKLFLLKLSPCFHSHSNGRFLLRCTMACEIKSGAAICHTGFSRRKMNIALFTLWR